MSPNALYNSLLRPSILHILRAAGFHATRPAVLDTLVDIAIRYLTFLATKTASHALMNRNDPTPTIMDVRMALQDAGSLYPQISVMEEQCREEEDLRGVKAFIDWMQGEANHEIRRIAGLANTPGEPVVDINALETAKEDFLTVLKKKHSKTGEESRFQGTVLGIPAEGKPVIIEGGPFESIQAWAAMMRGKINKQNPPLISPAKTPPTDSTASSPLTEIEMDVSQWPAQTRE